MRIGELAKRAGLSAPTLRYYEEIGLVGPAERTPAGYREYRPAAAARLSFIARAKALGLSLEEIKELLDICDGDGCDASEERLRHVLAHKIVEVRRQIAEQTKFRAELEEAFERLSARRETLKRELKVIRSSDCSCDDACTLETWSKECRCCSTAEEVSDVPI